MGIESCAGAHHGVTLLRDAGCVERGVNCVVDHERRLAEYKCLFWVCVSVFGRRRRASMPRIPSLRAVLWHSNTFSTNVLYVHLREARTNAVERRWHNRNDCKEVMGRKEETKWMGPHLTLANGTARRGAQRDQPVPTCSTTWQYTPTPDTRAAYAPLPDTTMPHPTEMGPIVNTTNESNEVVLRVMRSHS